MSKSIDTLASHGAGVPCLPPNGFATREQLLGVRSKRRYDDTLTLPISGLSPRIQSLTEREVSRYQMKTVARRGGFQKERMLDATRRLIVLCLVDKAGAVMFAENEIAWMEEWDSADTQYLYDACVKHCGINAADMEDLVKNSDKTPAIVSPTESPDNAGG